MSREKLMPPHSYLLCARQFEALSLCCDGTEVDESETIAVLQSLHTAYPELVTVRTFALADLYERIEASTTALGRSLVHAYLVGKCEAYHDVRLHAEVNNRTDFMQLDRLEAMRCEG